MKIITICDVSITVLYKKHNLLKFTLSLFLSHLFVCANALITEKEIMKASNTAKKHNFPTWFFKHFPRARCAAKISCSYRLFYSVLLEIFFPQFLRLFCSLVLFANFSQLLQFLQRGIVFPRHFKFQLSTPTQNVWKSEEKLQQREKRIIKKFSLWSSVDFFAVYKFISSFARELFGHFSYDSKNS